MQSFGCQIRQEVREEVERRAEKNEKGQFLDANTHEPIEGQYDLGHKAGHEHWREVEQAEKKGLTQEEFNERMNNPDYFQIEDPHENRSHSHEMPAEETQSENQAENTEDTQDSSGSVGEGQSEENGQEM